MQVPLKKPFIKKRLSAIILAGGKSTRMKENKAFLPVDSVPLIQKVANNIEDYFQEIIISTSSNSKEMFDFLPYRLVVDHQSLQGPLMGILSGLRAAKTPVSFVIACDIPEINIPFLHKMMIYIDEYEIVVPVSGQNKFEPLFAFYNKCLIPRIEHLLNRQTFKVTELFPLTRVKYVPLDNSGWFYNINTTGDYRNYLNGQKK
jgi:molybdopterin-guanine dinucleotide biosynthesis protein A